MAGIELFGQEEKQPVPVFTDIWAELLSMSKKNDSQDCQNKNCDNERAKIQQRTDCEGMIKDYKKYPDWPLKPTLAKRIVEQCWEEYH